MNAAPAWKNMRLHGVSRRYRNVRYIETSVVLRRLSRRLRQIAVCDLGHEQPTPFLADDTDIKPVDLVERYAHRMLIENGIAENADF